MKKCTLCNRIKPKSDFGYRKDGRDGLEAQCKICKEKSDYIYSKSLRSLISSIYNKQVSKSKDRKHPLPNYSKVELRDYILNHPNFKDIHKGWVDSNYSKWLKPSIDRLDISKGYCFSNIRLVTWRENHQEQNRLMSTAVYRIDRYNGKIISEYISIMDACRKHGLKSSGLSKAIKLNNGKLMLGSIWMLKNDYSDINYRNKQLKVNKLIISVVLSINDKLIIKLFLSMDEAFNYIKGDKLYDIKSMYLFSKLIHDSKFPYIFKAVETLLYIDTLNKIKEKSDDSEINDVIVYGSRWYKG